MAGPNSLTSPPDNKSYHFDIVSASASRVYGKSFTNRRSKSRPITDPSGTPLRIGMVLESSSPTRIALSKAGEAVIKPRLLVWDVPLF